MKYDNMNVKLEYLYRDNANYKQYSEVIISNIHQLSINYIKNKLYSLLIDGEHFIPQNWNLPKLHYYEYDGEIDHEYHEIFDIKLTSTKINSELDIMDILNK
ncbi:MAG TPA: hypothetical protein PKD51_10440 [Saprospiraceae bacterium]|nr:hypothetical protein [Saprospiraceae bacterium]HMU04383.1 hypothetical protein [Saprospiraceae bacterium]